MPMRTELWITLNCENLVHTQHNHISIVSPRTGRISHNISAFGWLYKHKKQIVFAQSVVFCYSPLTRKPAQSYYEIEWYKVDCSFTIV